MFNKYTILWPHLIHVLTFVLLRCSEDKQSNLEDSDVEEVIRRMPVLDRAHLGFICKEIIDIGRLLSLRDQGMDAQLVKYVPSNISPENHLLLAKSRFEFPTVI